MTKAPEKITDPDKIDLEAARQVVDKEDAARKDGVTVEQVDAASGIVMKPDPNDRSVRTYDPQNVERQKPEPELKPSKNSGEPVHERS